MSTTGPNAIDIRVAQFKPELGDVESNKQQISRMLQAAASDDVDLVVFPELALTGYHIGDSDTEQIVKQAATAIQDLAEVAPDVTTILGTPIQEGEALYNSAAVLSGGETIGAYHKTHLYNIEDSLFDQGDEFPIFETEIGAIGVQICYDVEFPEISRQLVLGGADVLVTISANMHPFTLDQETYHRARALESIRPHVLCNRIGTEREVEFFGRSGIVDERGRTIVMAGEDRPVELTATVNLGAEGEETLQYLVDRRPEIYTRN